MSVCPLLTERTWIGDDFGRVCPLDRSRFADCDSCPYAPALKAVVEDESLVLVAMKRQPTPDAIFIDDLPDKDGE